MSTIINKRQIEIRVLVVLTLIVISVAASGFVILYNTSIDDKKRSLIDQVQSQARLMEAVAKFDAFFQSDHTPGKARAATLSQIKESFRRYTGLGKTGELLLAVKVDNKMVFLLPSRKLDFAKPKSILFNSHYSQAMQLALSEKSGVITALDHQGVETLAAYEYLPFLEMGLVAKIDMSEVNTPFIKAGTISGLIAVVAIIFGLLFNRRMVFPLIKHIYNVNEKLEINEKRLKEAYSLTKGSIEYASLIQSALIPEKQSLDLYFKDNFVIWQPKDIVGGDIYLYEPLFTEDECLLMVIDCTGHGVPGAFVTMLVKAIERMVITEIMNNKFMRTSPARILEFFNINLKKILKQESDISDSNVGFDGGIVYYNKTKNLLKFAGAETPLFYFQDNKLTMIKGDRHSIGYKQSDAYYKFTEHKLNVVPGMQLYLSTDGYLDQNGGERGYPMGKKRFKEIIMNNFDKDMQTQKQYFLEALSAYQMDEERNDDITVVGLRV